jgi:DNA-binding response OmpR family regulator
MERSGLVQTREQLFNEIWDMDSESGPRAIDRHVCYLRAKLGPLANSLEAFPVYLVTKMELDCRRTL